MTPPSGTEHPLTQGVLDVLAGAAPQSVAACRGLDPQELVEAAAAYAAAGQSALQLRAENHGWHQVHIQFADWHTAEALVGKLLRPQLLDAEHSGSLDAWWFIRKAPCWRLRLLPGPTATAIDHLFGHLFDGLIQARADVQWKRTIYEPEIAAFGGPETMDTAHELFHADSRAILDYLHNHTATIGRRELSTILCGALFRGARQDEYEQADIWHRITRMRPLPDDIPDQRLRGLGSRIRGLLTPRDFSAPPNSQLAFVTPWQETFTHTGRLTAHAAHTGTLQRGLRAVIAHHVIFHWNRIGLPARTQSIIAHAAHTMIMQTNPAQKR